MAARKKKHRIVGIRLSCPRMQHSRRPVLYRNRGIKDVLIALSSLQQHTTHTHTHYSLTHQHPHPQTETRTVIKLTNVLQRELGLRPHLPVPLHDRGHGTLMFHPGRDHVHGPGSTRPTTATLNGRRTSLARTSGVYNRVLRGCMC